jgi:myosin heavy subunit
MATETVEKAVEKDAPIAEPLFKENGLGMSEFLKPTSEEKADAIPPVTPAQVAEVQKEAKPDEAKKAEEKPESLADLKEEAKNLKKQLKDVRDGYSQERKTNKESLVQINELKQAIGILTKKIDGTYDEQKDAPRVLTNQEIETEAETRATVRTSHFAAVEYLMARDKLTEAEADAKVKELVWGDEAPFRAFDHDRAVQARVLGSKVPIIEALKVVQEAEDKKKYGDSPAAMREALKKELTEQIETKVRDKLLKELKGKGVPLEELKGLGGVQSVSPDRAPQAEPRVTLESLFPNFKGAGS